MKLRKKRHLLDVSLDESAETEQPSLRLDVEDQGLNPEQLYAQNERQQILSKAINDLTPGMRKAIELRELGERSTEETAQIMGISVSAVKARVFHGRRILRERLKDYVGSSLEVWKRHFANDRKHERYLARSGRLQRVWLKRERREGLSLGLEGLKVSAPANDLAVLGSDSLQEGRSE